MCKKTLQHISCDVVLSRSCQGQGRVSHDDFFDVPQLSFILSFYLAPVSTPCTSITLTGDFNRILLIPQLMLVRFHLHLLSVSPTIPPPRILLVCLYMKPPFLPSILPSTYLSAVGTNVFQRGRAPSYTALWLGCGEDIIRTQPHPRYLPLHWSYGCICILL